MPVTETNLAELLLAHLSDDTVSRLIATVRIHPAIGEERGPKCSRAVLAQALNLGLLADLLERVPTARAYVDALADNAEQLLFDHGALRTVSMHGMGSLPTGQESIARLLRPLGYVAAELYPLDRLKMTGRSYRHIDFPEDLPQFFLSELHVDRFSPEFQQAVARVTQASTDPLQKTDLDRLAILEREDSLPLQDAILLLGPLMNCFQRCHSEPSLSDYELLLSESAEMAWISTEGNAFNHATDRVTDLEAVVQAQRNLGRPMKDKIEISRSQRVRQTAYRADTVLRAFVDINGDTTFREVPGSFFEFIQRDRLPNSGDLDLSFDTGNAQGIFKMTSAPTG